MSNVKTMLRVGGVALAALGLMFLPIRNYVFDKGDLSAFHDVTELAVFNWVAFGLILLPGTLHLFDSGPRRARTPPERRGRVGTTLSAVTAKNPN